MGRVIAIGPGGKPQAPARDDRWRDFIGLVLQHQMMDKPLLSPPCRDSGHADDTRRALFRSARYYCSCGKLTCTRRWKNYPHEGNPQGGCPDGGQRVSCRAEVVKDKDGKLRVQVRLHDKKEAMRSVVAKYGPDPAKWPYQASAKRLKA